MKRMDDIRAYLARMYDIGEIYNVSTLGGGYSRVFRIDSAAGSFVFKETKADGINMPQNEPYIHQMLKENGVPVSTFVENREHTLICEDEGNCYHLQTLEKGLSLKRNTADPSLLKQSAQMLGRLHRILGRCPSLPEGMSLSWCMGIQSGAAAAFHRASLPWAGRAADKEIGELLEWKLSHIHELDTIGIDFSRLTRSNTHGDYHIYQLLIMDGRISAVLDFTGASRLPLCWEVIRSFCYADPACVNGDIDLNHLIEYVSAYLGEYKLTQYDLEKMADYFYFQLLACNYFNQAEHAHPDNAGHILDITVWASKICRTLGVARREIGSALAALAR